jgi:hypothetical protein
MARPTNKQIRIKQARELLENKTLLRIFEDRENEIVERWIGSTTVERRETCYFEITALAGLKDAIYATATDDD